MTYLDDFGINRYQSIPAWEDCAKEFLSSFDVLSGLDDVSFLFDRTLYLKDIAEALKMSNWLKGSSEIATLFKKALEKWTVIDIPKLSNTTSVYKNGAIVVTGTVQAEAYENSVHDDKPLLLSSYKHNPVYNDNSADISVGNNHVSIPIFCDSSLLTEWLQGKGILPRYYDKNIMTTRPCDEQTILVDKTLFRPTQYGNKGNRLYERITNPDEWWCLDRGHRGTSVHLEVFNCHTGMEIHVSEVDKINFFRELNKREKNRKWDKERMP